jgi:hypothetical protein
MKRVSGLTGAVVAMASVVWAQTRLRPVDGREHRAGDTPYAYCRTVRA